MKGDTLEGKFNPGRSGVVLDANLEDAIGFATWFRSRVPSHIKLLFYDEGCTTQIDLQPGMTEQDLIASVNNHI